MKKFFDILRQPHPAHDVPWIYFRTIGIISICIFLIIWLLTPFDAKVRYGQHITFVAGVYALGSFACMCINYIWVLVFPRLFSQENWTIGKEILIVLYQFATIALVIAVLSAHLVLASHSPISYPKAFFIVGVEGVMPYLIAIFIKHIYLLRRHYQETQEINQLIHNKTDLVTDTREEKQHSLVGVPEKLLLNDLLYIESRGNYLHLFIKRDEDIGEITYRDTIKQFMDMNAAYTTLFRCHRAFVVNVNHILEAEGNASGYRLTLHPSLPQIPVSRSHTVKFRSSIQVM